MDKKERDDARKTLAEITKTLEDETLSAEQRQELEIHAARLSGFLLSVWFPVDWSRRGIMIGIVALGAYGLKEKTARAAIATGGNRVRLFALWAVLRPAGAR